LTDSKTKRREAPEVLFVSPLGKSSTREIDDIVLHVIGRVADKWTMSVLEILDQNGTLRFTHIARLVGEISQRMLTKTLRQMEQDGFVVRKVHAEVPPRVDYTLTALGTSLCEAFCSVWTWAEKHRAEFTLKKRPTGR
jgi:DNA-binding HxlR family transcriptional regulator